jgi:hypothetical protein
VGPTPAQVFEALAVVACFDDVAVMGQPVEQRSGHLVVTELAGLFAEARLVATTTEAHDLSR